MCLTEALIVSKLNEKSKLKQCGVFYLYILIWDGGGGGGF